MQISALAAKVKPHTEAPLPGRPGKQKRTGKNSVEKIIFEQAWRFYGVDLSAVPGLGANVISILMSEVGPRADHPAMLSP